MATKKRSKRNIVAVSQDPASSITSTMSHPQCDHHNRGCAKPMRHCTTASQIPQKHCEDTCDTLIEIVEIDDQSNSLPIVTSKEGKDILTRIRAKNMVKGVTKMTQIYKDLV